MGFAAEEDVRRDGKDEKTSKGVRWAWRRVVRHVSYRDGDGAWSKINCSMRC